MREDAVNFFRKVQELLGTDYIKASIATYFDAFVAVNSWAFPSTGPCARSVGLLG